MAKAPSGPSSSGARLRGSEPEETFFANSSRGADDRSDRSRKRGASASSAKLLPSPPSLSLELQYRSLERIDLPVSSLRNRTGAPSMTLAACASLSLSAGKSPTPFATSPPPPLSSLTFSFATCSGLWKIVGWCARRSARSFPSMPMERIQAFVKV